MDEYEDLMSMYGDHSKGRMGMTQNHEDGMIMGATREELMNEYEELALGDPLACHSSRARNCGYLEYKKDWATNGETYSPWRADHPRGSLGGYPGRGWEEEEDLMSMYGDHSKGRMGMTQNHADGMLFGASREEELGLGNAWNAGWARHYAAGVPTAGGMGKAFSYGKMFLGGEEEDLALSNECLRCYSRFEREFATSACQSVCTEEEEDLMSMYGNHAKT